MSDFDYTDVLEDGDIDEYGEPTFELMDEEMAQFHIRNNTDYKYDAYKSLAVHEGCY